MAYSAQTFTTNEIPTTAKWNILWSNDAYFNSMTIDQVITNWVLTGLVVPTSGTLAATTSAGTAYISGLQVTMSATAHTYTASKDTYVDLDSTGTYFYTEVANGAASPALTAGRMRIAKVVTSGSAVTAVTQFGTDSLGNAIYNRRPHRYGQTVRQDDTTNSDQVKYAEYDGWGYIQSAAGASVLTKTVTFPGAFAATPLVMISPAGLFSSGTPTAVSDFAATSTQFTHTRSITTTSFVACVQDGGGSTNNRFGWVWRAKGALL